MSENRVEHPKWEPCIEYIPATKEVPQHIVCSLCKVQFSSYLAWRKHRVFGSDYRLKCGSEKAFEQRGMMKNVRGFWLAMKNAQAIKNLTKEK
jgi:hypothetical protein